MMARTSLRRSGNCIMLEGNPITKERLEDAGCSSPHVPWRRDFLEGEGGAHA